MISIRSFLLLVIVILLIVALSCGISKEASPKERTQENTLLTTALQLQDWEKEWQNTIIAAKKEKVVTVYSTTNAYLRTAFQEALMKKYGITMEMLLGKGVEMGQKLKTERRAGLNLADVWLGGSSPAINTLKPIGAFEPIRPALILPEITDTTLWYGNELPIFVDREKKYLFFTDFIADSKKIVVIRDTIREGELKSYYDLLQPKWKGKIAIRDVTSGGGLSWFGASIISGKLSLDYMKQLAGQEPLISRNDNILIESVIRKGFVGITLGGLDVVKPHSEAGVDLVRLSLKEDIATLSAGGGGVLGLINGAPHPNAAKIFINWLLSREGQTLLSRTLGYPTFRVDIPVDHVDPENQRIPGMEYFNPQSEDYIEKLPELAKLSTEIFGQYLR